MASQAQIESTYNYLDGLWRHCLGENADCSGAMYDGDFALTLEQAQKKKHDFALGHLSIKPGDRVLDVGCGWGAMLSAIRGRGAHGVGVTLSTKQYKHCKRCGFEVYLRDWKAVNPAEMGQFDAITSVGSFEHYCSDDEFIAGKQNQIYDQFFKFCYALLPIKRRMFLQTMTFGRYVPDPAKLTLDAKKGSDERIMALVRKFYPGSWLPAGLDHIKETARPYFKFVTANSGRLDYIETIDQWDIRFKRFNLKKIIAVLRIFPYFLKDPELRYKLESARNNCNQECFKRRLMDHYRIVLEKH